jgi:DNA-binding transcriptional MerR regulator
MKSKRYNMREAAQELGVTRQTLYYWFKKGWVKPKRDYRNYPVFTQKDIIRIKKWRNVLK